MSTILDTIIAAKRLEVERDKPLFPLSRLREEGPCWQDARRSLKAALLSESSTGMIAEFKRKSPSKGWFKEADFPVEPVVSAYDASGAAAISVLTDTDFFGGSLNDLRRARLITRVPLLRKDFIIDEWQIAQARAFGADLILLIAACLSPRQVQDLAGYAVETGLEVLLELHEEEELGHICSDTVLVGINNRDLRSFKVDIDRSIRMAARLPEEKIRVAESGISGVEEVERFREAGFRGFLVGERFMKTEDPGEAFRAFVQGLKGYQ